MEQLFRRLANVRVGMGRFISIDVKQGKILGEKRISPAGNSFYCFKGIPYALPPIGKLRFQSPQPLLKFDVDVLDCTKERNVAFQKDAFSGELVGSEDCLYLNVYTPNIQMSSSLPVMVWIHGGAYMMGSGNSDFFYPWFLMDENVIIVTLNYRLSMFGFLSCPSLGISGNAGLKDQLMALKWVKENIHRFGGDHNNITLFGHSAGAAAVQLHYLSEKSKPYFDKAIFQSGTCINEWAIQIDPEQKTRKLAKLLGFNGPDNKIIEFLRDQNCKSLLSHLLTVLSKDERRRGLAIAFRPVVEIDSEDAIITKSPIDLLKNSNSLSKPVMMGYTSSEGLTMLSNARKKLNVLDADLASLIPRSINLKPDDPECLILAEEIRKFYFNGEKINENNLENLKDLLTDYHFTIGMNMVAELLTKNHSAPLYFYKFCYEGGLNMYKRWLQLQSLKGVCHGDELFYLFQMEFSENTLKPNPDDEKMIKTMCQLWSNFARYGDPTPKNLRLDTNWLPVKKRPEGFVLDYLKIDQKLEMESNPEKKRIDFWRNVFQKYGTTNDAMKFFSKL